MKGFTRSLEADEDLFSIWHYIAEDNLEAANRQIIAIDKKCALLAENPLLGQARPDIAPEVRHFIVGNYLILYREMEGGILIVRVLHMARNISGVLGEN